MASPIDNGGVRKLYGQPSRKVVQKQLAALDQHCREFIALSPFLVVASASATGSADASPRGDAPGFVAVLDDRTLLIPDRPGNNRVDTILNVVENPHVGLLFLIPGIDETLRVNGQARLTTDAELLQPLAFRGKPPKAGLLVAVEEAFLHCGKALIRSELWNPQRRVPRKRLPSLGHMIADQVPGTDAQALDDLLADDYRNHLY